VATRLRGRGSSPLQAQVAWIKEADAGPMGSFEASSETLAVHLARVVTILKQKCPNLRLAYFTSRIYAGYATTVLNPEPYAYESGFAVRRVLERQLSGDPELNFDPAAGAVTAPWLAWGPYLWADGLTPRSDGLTWDCAEYQDDGTHPSPAGQLKVADSLLAFFQHDATTAPWYLGTSTLDVSGALGSALELGVSPNPAREDVTFTLRAPAGSRWRLTVCDLAGRIVYRDEGVGTGGEDRLRWDLAAGLPGARPASYWARLDTEAGHRVVRLVRLTGSR